MSQKDIKLTLNKGVDLQQTSATGVSAAVVREYDCRFDLTWDRFLRLYNTAEAVKKRVESRTSILDVGGFDGALAMFLPDYTVDVVDPLTTGGSVNSVSSETYDAVVSIDALEHVAPEDRKSFTKRVCSVSRKDLFMNFPGQQSANAQRLVYELTDNPLIKDHVEWNLPDRQEVQEWLKNEGFEVVVMQHTCLSQWVSQYLLQTFSPDVAAKANRHLIEKYLEQPIGTPLYDLLIGQRAS